MINDTDSGFAKAVSENPGRGRMKPPAASTLRCHRRNARAAHYQQRVLPRQGLPCQPPIVQSGTQETDGAVGRPFSTRAIRKAGAASDID